MQVSLISSFYSRQLTLWVFAILNCCFSLFFFSTVSYDLFHIRYCVRIDLTFEILKCFVCITRFVIYLLSCICYSISGDQVSVIILFNLKLNLVMFVWLTFLHIAQFD